MDYNKKLRYRKHHQLTTKGFDISTMPLNMVLSSIIVIMMILFKIEYFNMLKAFDFAMFITVSLYQFILKTKIYRGKIKAYYRRDYKRLEKLISNYILVAATSQTRYILFGAYTFYIRRNIRSILFNSFHYIITPISLAISFFFLYIVFYQDKYSTIKEYSNKINYNIKVKGMSERIAIQTFKVEKDKNFDIKEFRGMYYDHPENEIIKEKEKEKKIPLRRNPRLNEKVGERNVMDRRTQK